MRGKIEASVWLYLMTLLHARMTFCGKERISEADGKREENISSGKFNGRRVLVARLPKAALKEKHIQLRATADEKVEEIDEAVVRPSIPAKSVADSLVEIVEEKIPSKLRKDNFSELPLVKKNYTLSLATSKSLTPKVVVLQSSPGKAQVEKIQKFTKADTSSGKSRIVSRVSIPGKHRPFNSSLLAWPNWKPLYGNQLQTSALPRQRSDGGNVATNEANLMDRARNIINKDDRVAILHKPITSKILNKTSSLIRTLSPRRGVNQSMPKGLPLNNVLPTDSTEDPSFKKTTTDSEDVSVIKGRPKSVSQTSQSFSVKNVLPFTEKVKNIQEEPEVFDGLTHKNTNMQTKTGYLPTKDSQASKARNASLRILPSQAKNDTLYRNLPRGGKSTHVNFRSKTHYNHHTKLEVALSNTVWANVKSNTRLHLKSGTGVDLPKIKPRDRFLVAGQDFTHDEHVWWPINVHHGRNDSTLRNMKLKGNFTFPLNSAAKKHFEDLIKFFNSFNSSSNKNSTAHLRLQPRLGKNFTSEAKVKMRHRIMKESLHKILKFIHQRKKPRPNEGFKVEEPHLKHSVLLENETQLLKKGWNKIIKSKGFGFVKGSPLINNHLRSNHTESWSTNNGLGISAENTYDKILLQIMQNVSQKELLKLEGDIINALSFVRSWSLSQPNKTEIPQQQYGNSFQQTHPSVKHQQRVHSESYKQEHHKQEEPTTEQNLQQQHLPKRLENTLEQTQLQIMRNASRKELLKLENDIINALSHARLINVTQPNETQSLRKLNHSSVTDRDELVKQDFHFKEGEKHKHYQKFQKHQKTIKQLPRKLQFGVHQTQTTTASEHHQEDQFLHKHLQETKHPTNNYKNKPMSMGARTRGENCTSKVLQKTINKHVGNKCSHRNVSSHSSSKEDFFPHSRDTAEKNTAAVNKTDLPFKTRPNSVILPQAIMTKHSSSRKISETKALHFGIGDKAYHKRPSFEEVEVKDGTRNVLVHFDKDSPQNMDIESIAEGKLGSGILEMTEFVDQAPDKVENLVTQWSAWSPCTQSCGNLATRKRVQYECSSNAKVIRDCAVSGEQQETCVLKPCSVHGRFLSWSKWHTCSRSCGMRGVSVRTRSCTQPRFGGQPCFGTSVETRPCNRKHCPVNGGLSEWSKFGLCSKSCGGGVKMRHRECNKPVPRYGGTECDPKDLFHTKACGSIKCSAKTLKSLQVANVDPKTFCDFNPCEEVGCLYDPAARCITDFECNPTFFNINGKMLPNCKGIDSLYSKIPQVICNFNPCFSEKCSEIRSHCMVDLKCRPVFIDVDIRTIPPQCQVHGTVRVDRLKGEQTWTKSSPANNKQSLVSLASDLTPSFTQLWYPVTPAKRLGQFESPVPFTRPKIFHKSFTATTVLVQEMINGRMKGASVYPMALARPLSAYTTAMAAVARKHAVEPLGQRPVTEVFIEKRPGDNDDDFDDDDDDDDDDNADEDDDEDGNVHVDLDDDK